MLKTVVICFGLVTLNCSAFGQYLSSLREKTIFIDSDTIKIDSLSIQPGSLKIIDNPSFASCFILDEIRGIMIRKTNCGPRNRDSLKLSYRVFPVNFTAEIYNRSRRFSTPEERGIYNPFVFNPQEKQRADNFSGLSKSGSISRGLSLGNNQDLSVNSSLNLQLSGKITPEIDIQAAITDDNIPIQPDGNTQQLQDFDKVYIQLSDHQSRLIVGDFQITRPQSYFMNFNKRLQGIGYNIDLERRLTGNPKSEKAKIKSGVNAAVARGRFYRNQITGIEGNQGPYRLKGASNEQFIIILSGSEKVYIDGKMLKRGQENDYVIDYNTAEVTFTSRNLITKDKRIFVEFEYSDRNYTRSLFYLNNEVSQGKFSSRFNFYSEQDSKNQPLQQKLEAAEKDVLRSAGDNLQLAVFSSEDSIAYSNDFILYLKKDTLVNSILYKGILEFSQDPMKASYRATFTNVGTNRGNYIQEKSALNGKVFKWVSPENNVPQGNFEPVIQLIPPTKRQILTYASDYRYSKHLNFTTEIGLSRFDKNTFSNLDSDDDNGYAIRFGATDTRNLGKDSLPWILKTLLSYEQVDRNFNPIERFRNVEFDRDWNLANTVSAPKTEYLPRLSMNISKTNYLDANYLFTSFIRGKDLQAFQHSLQADYHVKKSRIIYNGSQTNNISATTRSGFYRHKSSISQTIGSIRIGYEDEFENNLFTDKLSDSLRSNSYRFYDRQVYIQNRDTTKNKVRVFYRIRTDDGLSGQRLKQYASAENTGFSTEWNKNDMLSLRSLTSYRRLSIRDPSMTIEKPDENLVNRIELSVRLFKSAITNSFFYEIGSGRETRKEFTYLEVQPGQGVYQWTDYNSNGIRELNEFEIAAFPDQARYIRIFTPTQDFIKVYFNQFNEILNIRSPQQWSGKKGFHGVISRFSGQLAMRMETRTSGNKFPEILNPFYSGINDPELITLNQSFRNSLFFNRSDPHFGLDYTWQKLASKALLNNGLESRQNIFSNLRLRWSPGNKYTLNVETKNGTKFSEAAFFNNRNYRIKYLELEPKLSYQPGVTFRFSLSYKYSLRENQAYQGGETGFNHNLGMELRYNVTDKGSFQANLNMIKIRYNGLTGTPVAFEMLEGLRPGQNFTWNLGYQRTLANNMQITFQYDGRKSPENRVVHVGNVQARVFF